MKYNNDDSVDLKKKKKPTSQRTARISQAMAFSVSHTPNHYNLGQVLGHV